MIMARKTTSQIEQAIYDALEQYFVGRISGMLYPSDCRPLDSNLEDAVISVGSTSSEQIQTGRAKLNIYVPDIDNNSGRLVPDKERLNELSILTEDILKILNEADTDYLFGLSQATGIIAVPDINQHFVNINLEFDCITFNN